MRSSAVLLLFVSSLLVKVALGQSESGELTIQGQTGKLYLQHTVVAKENWYSIGRLYNLSPKVIAPFNNLTLATSLTIGQQLEIPLNGTNFSQDGVKDVSETLVPVYHIVQEKEWMYRVSVNHNKVPIPSLEKWNHINKDQVHAGMHLIVGYLKVKTALSALAKGGGAAIAVNMPVKPQPRNEEGNDQPKAVLGGTTTNGTAPVTRTTQGREEAPARTTQPAVQSAQPVQPAAQPTAQAPVHTPAQTPVQETTQTPASEENNTAVAPATVPSAKNNTNTNTAAMAKSSAPSINFNGGFFKADFSNNGKTADGQAGTFKSTSGWSDGKYYALMNNLPVGTIIRITSSNTHKSVYAKVLGQLPDMKESGGLTVRISNAAANELGEGDGRFGVEVKY